MTEIVELFWRTFVFKINNILWLLNSLQFNVVVLFLLYVMQEFGKKYVNFFFKFTFHVNIGACEQMSLLY